jgi:hypothetical protein
MPWRVSKQLTKAMPNQRKQTIYLLLGLAMLSTMTGIAQAQEKQFKFMGKFEGRNAFVRTHHALFLGARLGVEFKFPIRAGVGYYWMQTDITSQLYRPQEYPDAGILARPRLRYAVIYAEYTFWNEDDWSLSVPVQLGFGESFYRTNLGHRVAQGFVMPAEAGVDIRYMFARWAGLGVGIGYRVMLVNNEAVKESLNSPYYLMRINLVFSELFKRVRSK